MTMDLAGKLYVIAAPSGAGKTSLVKALVENNRDLNVAISHTTRPRRPDEQDGVNYHFVSPSAFASMRQENKFVEFSCFMISRNRNYRDQTFTSKFQQ